MLQIDGRALYSRAVYPGVSWFVLLSATVMLLEFNTSRFSPDQSHTAIQHFTLLASGQCLLIWLRSTVYCALSFSRDLQNQTVTVVRITPVSATQTLIAKMVASLAPLWIELIVFLPISVIFFSYYLSLPLLLVVSLTPFILCLSLVAGTVGLAIGTLTNQPHQAVRYARFLTFFLVALVPILKALSSSWMLPVIGLLLWLSIASRHAPHRLVFLVTSALTIGSMSLLNSFKPFGLDVTQIHPYKVVNDFYPNFLDPQNLTDTVALEPHALLYPLSVAGVYLLLAGVFFWLARIRFSYPRKTLTESGKRDR